MLYIMLPRPLVAILFHLHVDAIVVCAIAVAADFSALFVADVTTFVAYGIAPSTTDDYGGIHIKVKERG